MPTTVDEALDPRIRRTRAALQQALGTLLERKDFEKISVQDIADAAAVNRATFYDHYPDKFTLLEAMVDVRFNELLIERGVREGCTGALRAIVLGVCDYLAATRGLDCQRQHQMEPHFEAAVIAVVRNIIMEGLETRPEERAVPNGIVAAAVSWAIYGAAKEWVRTPDRCPSEDIVNTVVSLVMRMLPSEMPA